MESDVLKAVEEISGYTPDEMLDMYNDYGRMAKEWEAYAGTGLTPEEIAQAKDLLAAEKDGRLVTLPVGKIGDVVEWDGGVCKELFLIRGIVIYCDGTRYDLGEFMPVATDEHICRIIPRAEAEKVLGKEQGK